MPLTLNCTRLKTIHLCVLYPLQVLWRAPARAPLLSKPTCCISSINSSSTSGDSTSGSTSRRRGGEGACEGRERGRETTRPAFLHAAQRRHVAEPREAATALAATALTATAATLAAAAATLAAAAATLATAAAAVAAVAPSPTIAPHPPPAM